MSTKNSFVYFMAGRTKCLGSGLLMLITVLLLINMTACGQTAAKPTATLAPTATPAATIQPGDSQRFLMVGDLKRDYLLHIPADLDNLHPVPVVFVFHGSGGNGRGMSILGFNDIADKDGFLVVYPDGVAHDWNLGVPGLETHIDDFAFVRQMLADLGTIARIDPKRIYSTGWSAGANFSFRLACNMSETFAAIAPVEGWMFAYPCQPKQPVSVMNVHGSKDAYEGQTESETDANGATTDVVFLPVEHAIATWVQLDGCSGVAKVEKQGIVTHTVYASCKAGTVVELYALEGGGHSWPSQYVFPTLSTQGIWNFFKAHPKP